MPIKLKKTLYIGLGGTGVSTLLRVKKLFLDSYGEIPPMIGFVAIDTNMGVANEFVKTNNGEIVKLDNNELFVCTVRRALDTYRMNPNQYDWVPRRNASSLSTISGMGAGQVRSNGRFIAYYNEAQIKNMISNAVTRISQKTPLGGRFEDDIVLGSGLPHRAMVNVFASVAGGTGSGMIIDTLCMIEEAVGNTGMEADIIPWILLPDIFRKSLGDGPMTKNVLSNSFGALRTLDYIQHLNPADNNSIDFGHTRIYKSPFDFAYVFNDFNKHGISFDKMSDLIEVMALSAFLPSNNMGNTIAGAFDNIKNVKQGGGCIVRNKEAWAASTGSAELIYNGHAVGRAIAYRTISQICESMLGGVHSGVQNAKDFVDNENVLIRENDGRNDIIDALLNPAPRYSMQIDKDTTIVDINKYINDHIDNNTTQLIQNNFTTKLDQVKTLLNKEVAYLMDNTTSGCIGVAQAFLSALKDIIDICNGEMEQELQEFNQIINLPIQWGSKLNGIRNSGVTALLKGTIDEDDANGLAQEIGQYVINQREALRHQWAIRFYNDLLKEIAAIENKLTNLSLYLRQIQESKRRQLLFEQQRSASTSKFQIFLHNNAISQIGTYNIDDTTKASFHQHFTQLGGLDQWLNLSPEQIDSQLWTFAKGIPSVVTAVNTNIESILAQYDTNYLVQLLQELKKLSSPLWNYNLAGYNDKEVKTDKFFIVGVSNIDNSLLLDNVYKSIFVSNNNQAQFVSTNQTDRIMIMQVEDLVPIYAVNNIPVYKNDYDSHIHDTIGVAHYLDEKLNQRMLSDNFSVMPRVEQDNILQLWVFGFIFKYIQYDKEAKQYWMRSLEHGDALDDYRYELSDHRDVAFDKFKTESLFKEVEALLNDEIERIGNEPIHKQLREVQMQRNYLTDYANVSPLEWEQRKNPNFSAVAKLLTRENDFITKEYKGK